MRTSVLANTCARSVDRSTLCIKLIDYSCLSAALFQPGNTLVFLYQSFQIIVKVVDSNCMFLISPRHGWQNSDRQQRT